MGWPGERKEAGYCMSGKNAVRQRLFLPDAVEDSDPGREAGQREGLDPTIMWLRVPKQSEFVNTVSSPL